MQNVDVTLGSLESSSTDFAVSFDPDFLYNEGGAPYSIFVRPNCEQYDDDGYCIDNVPDLCPYLSLEPKDGENTEIGFSQNPFSRAAIGELNYPTDETDSWNLEIKSPCFEGECPSDYDSFQNGEPLPQSSKGLVFKCNLEVISNEVPPLTKNYLMQNVVYADSFPETIEVSAILTGELPVPERNPVIIVPGVLGTEISKTTENGPEKLWLDLAHNLSDIGDEFMDPLQFNSDLMPSDMSLFVGNVIKKVTLAIFTYDYTNSLVNEFQNQGYIEETDLFLFPYDWRYGVSEENVNQLKQKIVDVLTQSSADKVDVIAHSTGGLLVKRYVMENPTDNYIDKAIFVGVPNTGAPKAVKALIQGDDFGNFLVADSEMKKISKNLPVAYDLLPSEQYYNVKGSYVKIFDQSGILYTSHDLNYEEMNGFLTDDHELNAQALINAQNLHTSDFDNYDLRTAGVDLYSMNGCKAGTIGKIRKVIYHGFLGDYIKYLAPEEIPGDGTVPLKSSTNIPINQENKYYVLAGEHGKMLGQDGARQKIVNIISGSNPSTQNIVTQDISECELNGRAISVYSPLSIDVVDQNGNHTGLNQDGVSVENNIPNSDYEIMGEQKFVYLPTSDGQSYTLNIAGTGAGVFTLTDAVIENNNTTEMRVFENILVTSDLLGQVNLADDTTLFLDANGDEEIDQTVEPTTILDAEQAQNFVPDMEIINEIPQLLNEPQISSGGKISILPAFLLPAVSERVADEKKLVVPTEEQKNVPVSVKLLENIKNTQTILTTGVEQKTNLLTENTFSASPINSKTEIDYKIIAGICAGFVLIYLIAKKFVKL